MLRSSVVFLAAAVISVAAVACDSSSVTTMKVDLDEVIESGTVSPVDGISAAGQPNEAALAVFANEGYTTVIDLRTKVEDRGMDEAAVIAKLGMEYVVLPIGRDGITFENARTLDELIEAADGPVLLHCGSSNRVGALLALSKSLAGADDDAALQYGQERGLTSLEDRVKEVLGGKDVTNEH
jgi:uncharacterized protein (TIGR01244 family)